MCVCESNYGVHNRDTRWSQIESTSYAAGEEMDGEQGEYAQ